MNNAKIKEVSSAKYFGITINNHLTWSNHINNILQKVLSVKASSQHNVTSCQTNIKLPCYVTMVKSIIKNASQERSPYIKQHI